MAFTPEERQRYARHLDLPGFGAHAQERLRAGRVLVVGCGGLGSPALYYLAAAGVGRLGLMDSDQVDISNLQRQIMHGTETLGQAKTASGAAALARINPLVNVVQHETRLDAANAPALLAAYDIICDGTDNFATRFLLNDAAYITGQVINVDGGRTAHL